MFAHPTFWVKMKRCCLHVCLYFFQNVQATAVSIMAACIAYLLWSHAHIFLYCIGNGCLSNRKVINNRDNGEPCKGMIAVCFVHTASWYLLQTQIENFAKPVQLWNHSPNSSMHSVNYTIDCFYFTVSPGADALPITYQSLLECDKHHWEKDNFDKLHWVCKRNQNVKDVVW